jgi:hypothetical protein
MRPRKKNRNLPQRMFLNHGRYYYVLRGKWHSLSKDYAEALIQYSKHTASHGNGMAALIDRFMVDVAPKKTPKTQFVCTCQAARAAAPTKAPNMNDQKYHSFLIDFAPCC